jgi:hypothetical protein
MAGSLKLSGKYQNDLDSTLIRQFATLEAKAIDDYSRLAIKCAQRALADFENPMRVNFFRPRCAYYLNT